LFASGTLCYPPVNITKQYLVRKGEDMKILVIGMGNIGAIHGWLLSESGLDVTHVVRKGSLAKYAAGVRMDVLDLRGDTPKRYVTTYTPRIVDNINGKEDFELVLVATNHYQAADAVRQYRDLIPTADFLMFTANWKGVAAYDALLPRERYLWGFAVSTGGRGTDGVLYANIQKYYRIGELDGSRTPRLEKIITMFGQAGLTPDLKANIIEWQWVHHAIDAGLIGTALAAGGLPAADAGKEVWLLMVRAVKDALAVLERRGVDVWSYPDTRLYAMPDEEKAAAKLHQMIVGLPHYERTRQHSHFDTSPKEMQRFYLDVVETGEELGVPMPYLGPLKSKILGD